MVRKARRSASQWDSGMPMVPLKPRESEDMYGIFVSFCVGVCMCMLFSYSLLTQCMWKPYIFFKRRHLCFCYDPCVCEAASSLTKVVLRYLYLFCSWMNVAACSKLLLCLALMDCMCVCVCLHIFAVCAWCSCLLCFSVPPSFVVSGKVFISSQLCLSH